MLANVCADEKFIYSGYSHSGAKRQLYVKSLEILLVPVKNEIYDLLSNNPHNRYPSLSCCS